MNALRLIDKVLARFEGWLIIALLSLMAGLTFVQVCLRGLFIKAHVQWANDLMGYLDWSEPFVRLLVLWLTLLGASLVTTENKHIKIDLFSSILPRKWLPVRELIIAVVCVLICTIMSYVCTGYVKMEMEFGGVMFLNLPNWICQLILPVGFALLTFRFLLRATEQSIKVFGDKRK